MTVDKSREELSLDSFIASFYTAGPACRLVRSRESGELEKVAVRNALLSDSHLKYLKASIDKDPLHKTVSSLDEGSGVDWVLTHVQDSDQWSMICMGTEIGPSTTAAPANQDATSSAAQSTATLEGKDSSSHAIQGGRKRQRRMLSENGSEQLVANADEKPNPEDETHGDATRQDQQALHSRPMTLQTEAPASVQSSAAEAAQNPSNVSSSSFEPDPIAEKWLARWSQFVIPGSCREDALKHLELIRRVDWSKTSLGSMSTWSNTLLSSFSAALASPFPVLLAWGPDMTMLYNHAYGQNIGQKHPTILGQAYKDAWPEVWDILIAPTSAALRGEITHVNNAQMYLKRGDFLEECFFTWSMIPMYDETERIVGIYIPNFDNTGAVVTERRMRLLREASQSFSINTKVNSLFRRVCRATAKDPVDLPLVAFYDCSAAADEKEDSAASSAKEHSILKASSSSDMGQVSSGDRYHSKGGRKKDEHAITNNASAGEDHQAATEHVRFQRAALAGCSEDNRLFPPEIPPPGEEPDGETMLSSPSFLQHLREVQRTHKQVVLCADSLKPYEDDLEKVGPHSDAIRVIVILPIVTLDDNLRAVAIVGLNPRKAFDDDYQIFLDLFKAQVSHGVTSIRLINEEIRRSRFFAALIKRKNEELHTMLEARTVELRASELKFHKMAEISPAGIWTATPDGEITFVNEAWWQISGHPRDASPSTFLDTVHEADLEEAKGIWEAALKSKDSVKPCEFRWKRREGEDFERWCWTTSTPELDEYGNVVSITGALTDITEKKLMEIHQRKRAEEAIDLRRQQERFIDMTSHEMRNPLSAICLSADASAERLEALLRETAPQPANKQYLDEMEDTLQDLKIINHCCVHMTRLIDDILTLSKLDNQFLVITNVPCRPADFISETFSIFRSEMISKDIEYELEITRAFSAMSIDYVLTDPSRINQLVINILTNAIKFTAESPVRRIKITLDASAFPPQLPGTSIESLESPELGSSSATVQASALLPDTVYLICSISDTGRGLTPSEISGLFQRFKQANAKTHISYGGSGLGLFICRRLAELLGGEIGVQSERGKGSTFTFYIPTKRCAGPAGDRNLPSPGFVTAADLNANAKGTEAAVGTSFDAPLSGASLQSHGRSAPVIDASGSAVPDKLAVLIVEDNVVNQRLLDKHLTRVGCVTSCANNGLEAIEAVKHSRWARPDGPRIDCVLMDIEMPVMDGLSTIRELRSMEKTGTLTGHLPVLAVTANARQEQIENMIQSGFDGTISKPFKIPTILECIKDITRKSKNR